MGRATSGGKHRQRWHGNRSHSLRRAAGAAAVNTVDDRLFVYLRLEGDDNDEIRPCDGVVAGSKTSGRPYGPAHDTYDVGAEFFRWEFATAVAGYVLKVNPFDQPDVQSAKDMTDTPFWDAS